MNRMSKTEIPAASGTNITSNASAISTAASSSTAQRTIFIKVPAAQKVRSCCPGSPSGCLPVCLGTDRLTSNHRFFYL